MIERLRELARQRMDFAFETTLASRSFAGWLNGLRQSGYLVHLQFLWLRSPELAVERVNVRVLQGGHHVAEDVIRRRYDSGLRNFFGLYAPFVDSWILYDNSSPTGHKAIATLPRGGRIKVFDASTWTELRDFYS